MWALWRKWCSLIMLDNAAWEFLFTPPSSIATEPQVIIDSRATEPWRGEGIVFTGNKWFSSKWINEWTFAICMCSSILKQWMVRWDFVRFNFTFYEENKTKLKIIIDLSYVCKMRVKWALLLENSSWWNDGIYLLLQYTKKHIFMSLEDKTNISFK